jgi:hypothetical protein
MSALPTDRWQRPPEGASELALAWYAGVMAVYNIRDLDGRLTLHTIIRSFDRAERAADLIAKHGELVLGRDEQLKTNPACAVERDARAQMMQALKHLDIGVGPPKARPGKPMGPGR